MGTHLRHGLEQVVNVRDHQLLRRAQRRLERVVVHGGVERDKADLRALVAGQARQALRGGEEEGMKMG